jgi:hypothetical protein
VFIKPYEKEIKIKPYEKEIKIKPYEKEIKSFHLSISKEQSLKGVTRHKIKIVIKFIDKLSINDANIIPDIKNNQIIVHCDKLSDK